MNIDDMHPGPRDPTMLHLQAVHRSTEVWRVGGGDVLKCRHRNLNQTQLPDLHHRMIPLLQSTGFYGMARVSSLQLDWGLITALVERWRPETHTFHMPMRECTVTLQDVAVLLGLPVNGDPVIGVTPGPTMCWTDIVASIFGQSPAKNRFNRNRLQLSWFGGLVPHKLADNASEDDLRLYTRCYLVQLIGGSLFTDHSGGLIHCMWLPYIRDLDACGNYAWGAVVLAFLYRELCKGCKMDREEIAGCLILLQLWAWERFPTIAPIRTELPLVDQQFWEGHLPGPLGVRWLVGHSFSEKIGRTVSVYRVILDELGPSHFIWMPYSSDVLDSLPSYCLTGRLVWRYRGPLICIFIVEPHMVDRVSRQFGMLQSIPADAEYSSHQHRLTLQGHPNVDWVQTHQPSINFWNSRLAHIFESELIVGDGTVPEYDAWYVERTRRFHSRMGALHGFIGDLLKNIAERTESVLPDVFELATNGWNHIRDRSLYGLFEALPLEERRDKELEGRQEPGRRPKRGGYRGGRGGRGARGVVDQVIPLAQDENNIVATHLVDDHDPLVHEGSHIAIPLAQDEDVIVPNPESDQQPSDQPVEDPNQQPISSRPSFDLGLTPTPSDGGDGVNSQAVSESSNVDVEIPDVHQPTAQPVQQPTHERVEDPSQQPISSHPSFDLGLTPTPSDGGVEIPAVKPIKFNEPRRSKRVHKTTKCGTDGHKVVKRH